MKQMQVEAGIERLCGLFGISRQSWYEHQWRHEASLIDQGRVVEIVLATRQAHPGLDKCSAKLMYRIVQSELVRNGVKMGRDKFFEVLRECGLMHKRRRIRVRTTFSDVNLPLFPNLSIGIELSGPDQLWVSDITYLRVGESFNYLSLITDYYSHRIIGYYLSETLEAKGCLVSLKMALALRIHLDSKLIHHSDRGFQYRSQEYLKLLRMGHIRSSQDELDLWREAF